MLDIALDQSSAAPVSGAPVVSIKEVTHRYGGTLALDGLSLDIPSGRMVGIIGPDGVGKSTLMALIAGSKQIQQGKVIVLNGDMASARHRRDACPRIAYMSTDILTVMLPIRIIGPTAILTLITPGIGALPLRELPRWRLRRLSSPARP
jgi:ABC-type glutathione transport system ATPase component